MTVLSHNAQAIMESPMTSMQPLITSTDENGILIITVLANRLNEELQVNAFRDQVAEAIRGATPSGVIVDMKNIEYMTSIAIFPLVAIRSMSNERGAQMILCNLSDTVARILTVAQLIVESRDHAKHLTVAATLENALEMLRS